MMPDFLFRLTVVYFPIGILLCLFAWLTFRDREHRARRSTALYWLVLGIIFLLPEKVSQAGHTMVGLLVVALVLLDALNRVRTGTYPLTAPNPVRPESLAPTTDRGPGLRLFRPILLIPVMAVLGSVYAQHTSRDSVTGTLIGLALGAGTACLYLWALTRCQVIDFLQAGRKITEEIGPVNILPQLLASLGAVFTTAGVGTLLAAYGRLLIPENSLPAAILFYFFVMTAFTALMGNSFAAFAVVTTGIGIPLVIVPFGLNPALVGILGLTAGSCGTLLTPMAANFNILPATLLEMKDQSGVIKYQWKFALALWLAHPAVFFLWYWLKGYF